jgi:hypothetical protein
VFLLFYKTSFGLATTIAHEMGHCIGFCPTAGHTVVTVLLLMKVRQVLLAFIFQALHPAPAPVHGCWLRQYILVIQSSVYEC